MRRRPPGFGLRQFAMSVLTKVEKKGRTTYSEVADELVREVTSDSNNRSRAPQVSRCVVVVVVIVSSSSSSSEVADELVREVTSDSNNRSRAPQVSRCVVVLVVVVVVVVVVVAVEQQQGLRSTAHLANRCDFGLYVNCPKDIVWCQSEDLS